MYCVRKVTDKITWIGSEDRRLALFENVYPIPNGVSYNSYFIDDEKTIEFIKNYLPQDLKEKFSDDEFYYFLDLIDEYYVESGILDAQPDADGCVEIDLEKIVDYIVKEAKKDEMGNYDPEEILFVVQGEMEYTDSLGE